jgi:2-oxoglutarate ferredoxin oxidoreductase subunit alpha
VRLAVDGKAKVMHYGRMGGMMFSPDDVLQVVKENFVK